MFNKKRRWKFVSTSNINLLFYYFLNFCCRPIHQAVLENNLEEIQRQTIVLLFKKIPIDVANSSGMASNPFQGLIFHN